MENNKATQESINHFQLHNLLFKVGVIFFCIGLTSLIVAAVLVSISIQNFASLILGIIEVGVLLIWGGISIGTFFTIWVPLPRAGASTAQLVLFLFNQFVGFLLFGGLLASVGGYWSNNTIVSQRGVVFSYTGLGTDDIETYFSIENDA